MKAIAYLRVSTREQAESGLGLDAQRAACESLAADMGAELLAVHVDAGVSGGSDLDKCPALLDALDALDKGAVLIVAKRDRLGRDVYRLALVERMAARAGASIVSADGAGNGDDPAALLMRRMVDAFAEYERQLIAARTRAALARKKAKGERVGAPPFGFRVDEDGSTLIPDDREQRIREAIASARAKGLSYRVIARALNDEGLHNRAGRPFNHVTVHRIANADLAPVLVARVEAAA